MFSSKKKKELYVIDIFGAIEAAPSSSINSKNSDIQKVIKTLHKIEKKGSNKVAGVLIHLNTPGGTTGTSEEVATMVRKVCDKGIPVVASIADICCSGGYWIASACDYIFANRTSMTGSIGVIMQLPNFKGLSKKLGVNYYTVKAGKMKDIGNPFRKPSDEELQFLQEHAEETHRIFADAVSVNRLRSRRLSPTMEDNPDLFDGRPLSAETALEYNLIDRIGTFYDAMEYLLDMAEENEDDVEIVKIEKKRGFLSKLLSAEMDSAIAGVIESLASKGLSVH